MLIRSQDKKRIFDMTGSNIEANSSGEIRGYGNTFGINDFSTLLGKYPTVERAIEVLDEICDLYDIYQMPEV